MQSSGFVEPKGDRHPSSLQMMECEKLSGDHTVPFDTDCDADSEKSASAFAVEDEVDRTPPSVSVLSFVNIDSYEPDSSGGEEEGWSTDQSSAIQQRLDRICDLGKDFDNFGHSHACVRTQSCRSSDCSAPKVPSKPDQEDTPSQRTGKTYGKHGLLRKVQSGACNESASAGVSSPCSCVEPADADLQEAVQSEMVVRPKVRKLTSEGHLDKQHSQAEEASWKSGAKSSSAPPFFLPHPAASNFLFNIFPEESSLYRAEPTVGQSRLRGNSDHDDDFWEDLEDFEEKCATPEKGDERWSEKYQ